MKSHASLIALIIFCVGYSSAQAAQWTSWLVPSSIITAKEGIVVLLPGIGNPEGCVNGNENMVYLPTNDAGYGVRSDQFLSLVTTAIATGTEMRFYLDGCYSDTWQSSKPYNKVTVSVQLKKPGS